MHYKEDEYKYAIVVARRELEQAYYDLEYYALVGPERIRQLERRRIFALLTGGAKVMWDIYMMIRRVKRHAKRLERLQDKQDRAITKIARNNG